MPVTLLKSVPQALWLPDKAEDPNNPNADQPSLGYSSDGICYYMCEYVRLATWDKAKIKSIEEAIKAAKKAVPKTIIDAGKVKNLRDRDGKKVPQIAYVAKPPMELKANSVYRVGLWYGEASDAPVNPKTQNHEVVVLTGPGANIVFFEPNYGFYAADMLNQVNKTRKVVFETAVKNLYSPDGEVATNFHYLKDHSF